MGPSFLVAVARGSGGCLFWWPLLVGAVFPGFLVVTGGGWRASAHAAAADAAAAVADDAADADGDAAADAAARDAACCCY